MTEQQATSRITKPDHTGTIAEAFFIANLLFVGIFYLFLWGLYFISYKHATQVGRNHLKQALLASTITTFIVVALNLYVWLSAGYASATALIAAEVYLMLVVPIFLVLGILGFTKAVNEKDFKYPIIGNLLGINSTT